MLKKKPPQHLRLKKKKENANFSLKKARDFYLCFLPGNIGFLSSSTLKLFFSGITLGEDQTSIVKRLPEDAIVVYSTKYKSYFEYLFYHTRFRTLGLPYPEIGFDQKVFMWQPVSRILKTFLFYLNYLRHNLALPDPYESGYIREELINGRSGLLYLVDKKGFYRRFVKSKTDPIRYLVRIQHSIDRPIFIIPQLMLFSKKPKRSIPTLMDLLLGTEEKPGKIRRLVTLFKNPKKIFVEISEPVNIKEFISFSENKYLNIDQQALALRRYLLVQTKRHRQSITGPVLTSREELKESILTNDRLREFMEKHSKKKDIPIHQIHKKADAYVEEIAANYNHTMVTILEKIVTWGLRTLFEEISINHDELNKIKRMSQKGPLILVPCHKSHLDYLILSTIFRINNMQCPHIAAGKNLSFWPLGPIFRSAGAFFLRRTFKGAVLYAKVFAEYIQKILEEGFSLEFFIEGGRSRTGKLLMPKLGLLSILLNAYKRGKMDDMIFAPIYIGYDRVIEESSYIHEVEGGQKKTETFLQVIKAGKFLKKRYGKVYIKFHEPVSLKDYLHKNNLETSNMTSKDWNTLCRDLGHKFMNAIDNITVITPYAIVASAILNFSQQKFYHNQLTSNIETYMNHVVSQKAPLADTILIDHVHAFDLVLDTFVQRKFIDKISDDKKKDPSSNVLFKINENKRQGLEYYKNNCIAFFVPAAFTALSILDGDAFQFTSSSLHSSYTFLQEFFKNEFTHDVDHAPEYFVRKTIKAFIDEAVLMPHQTLPDTYNLTSAGHRKIKLFSNFLKTYFESYWVVLNFFMIYPKNHVEPKNRIKKIQSMGNRMYKRNEIERIESLSKVNYSNAVKYFISNGIRGSEDKEKIQIYADTIQKYLLHLE